MLGLDVWLEPFPRLHVTNRRVGLRIECRGLGCPDGGPAGFAQLSVEVVQEQVLLWSNNVRLLAASSTVRKLKVFIFSMMMMMI